MAFLDHFVSKNNAVRAHEFLVEIGPRPVVYPDPDYAASAHEPIQHTRRSGFSLTAQTARAFPDGVFRNVRQGLTYGITLPRFHLDTVERIRTPKRAHFWTSWFQIRSSFAEC